MQEAMEARIALENTILAAVKEYEERFAGAAVASVILHHETCISRPVGSTIAVQVDVRI